MLINTLSNTEDNFPFDIRDNPTPEFIDHIRAKYPTEKETDSLLARKMQRRSGPPYRHIKLDEMTRYLNAMLSEVMRSDYNVSEERWLTGGASKVQMAFLLRWKDSSGQWQEERLVIRMDPSEASNTTSRLREAELIQFFENTLPVPKVFWVDLDARWFPEPAIIYSYVAGTAKPKNSEAGKIAGLGTNFGPVLRTKIAPQFIEHLAKVHNSLVEPSTFTSMDYPQIGTTQCAQWQLNRARRVWEEDRGEDFALMDITANWLQRNLPTLDRISIVHGDFRSGNFLFDEPSGRITAWLDWERGHLGDRHRDLAWMTQREKGHFSEDGKTYLVCGLVPLDDFYRQYERASGLSIDEKRLTFYRILNNFQVITTVMATAYRVAKLGKSHQDVLLARLKGIASVISAEQIELLEENI